VPAFNEEVGIAVTLEKLERIVPESCEIIVVNDGSTDDTYEIARKYRCIVVCHPQNRGKGEALQTGIERARGENIVWVDADNTYPIDAIPQIIEELHNGKDAIVCSRAYGRENIPLFNRMGLWLFKVLIQGIYGFKPVDPCTGLYGMKRKHLVDMGLVSKRFAIEPEICMKGARMGLEMLEIPITYSQRVGGSKLNGVRVGVEDLLMIMRLVFWRKKK